MQFSWDSGLNTAHGKSIVKEGATEYLWLADNETGQVIKTTVDGEIVMRIERPGVQVYKGGKYAPTGVTVN